MIKDEKLSHAKTRQKLWSEVWARTAGSSNCINLSTPTKWADEALKEFDERFPAPKDEPQKTTE